MLDRFKKHITNQNYFADGGTILIAVSGGVDSMVLCALMSKSHLQYDVSHINHNTRNGESDSDERFVVSYFSKLGINVHVNNISHDGTGNFHDWAHRERYKIWESKGYDYILTAHHKDDNLETILINIFNGRSVSEIPAKNGKIIRPLLPFSKAEIQEYAKLNQIPYVEDASNQSDIYLRNMVRLQIIPLLKESPNASTKIENLAERLSEDLRLLDRFINESVELERLDNGDMQFHKAQLSDPTLIYHILKAYGIGRAQAAQMHNALGHVGSVFHSAEYTFLVDRDYILIKASKSAEHKEDVHFTIENLPIDITTPKVSIAVSRVSDVILNQSNSVAFFPEKSLKGKRLCLRYWRNGDVFFPFGMNGQKQTLKKFFANIKVDRFTKSDIPILCADEEIIWVCGYRTDERYRIEDYNSKIIRIELL